MSVHIADMNSLIVLQFKIIIIEEDPVTYKVYACLNLDLKGHFAILYAD